LCLAARGFCVGYAAVRALLLLVIGAVLVGGFAA
jgi:hypothetical protein